MYTTPLVHNRRGLLRSLPLPGVAAHPLTGGRRARRAPPAGAGGAVGAPPGVRAARSGVRAADARRKDRLLRRPPRGPARGEPGGAHRRAARAVPRPGGPAGLRSRAGEGDRGRGVPRHRPPAGGIVMSVDRARLERRIAELSAIGGSGTSVTRLGLSADEQRARDLVGGWLRSRGARVWRDAAANVYGRFGDAGPAILVGSHIDSVPEGGRFDGALGVLCAVEAVDALLDDGVRFKRPVEIVGWCDEEGARFAIRLFGSSPPFCPLPDRAAKPPHP